MISTKKTRNEQRATINDNNNQSHFQKMKKLYTLAAGLIALSLASCSNEEPIDNGHNAPAGEQNYIAINLLGLPGSRAEGDVTTEKGTDAENRITSMRFYFFDEHGEPCRISSNSNMTEPLNLPGQDASLVLATPNENGAGVYGQVPARIFAVVNADNYSDYENKNFSELNKLVTKNLFNGDDMVMTSVTIWENNVCVYGSEIKPENICGSIEDAMKSPVTCLVERLASKITVEQYTAEPVKVKEGVNYYYMENGEIQAAQKDIYVQPTGWTTCSTSDASYCLKHIEDYSSLILGNWTFGVHSYWNTSTGTIKPTFSYKEATNVAGSSVYLHENTTTPELTSPNAARGDATKIILVANTILTDAGVAPAADAKGDQILEWGGDFYSVEALCKAISSYTQRGVCIAPDPDANYLVKFYDTTDDAHNGKFITDGTHGKVITVPAAKFYNGACYYIVNVKSLMYGAGGQLYGVVRNHHYKYTIDKFKGLGTPAVDPEDEKVIPENPNVTESIVSANVEIVEWIVDGRNIEL